MVIFYALKDFTPPLISRQHDFNVTELRNF